MVPCDMSHRLSEPAAIPFESYGLGAFFFFFSKFMSCYMILKSPTPS